MPLRRTIVGTRMDRKLLTVMPGTGDPGRGKKCAAQRCIVSMNCAGFWLRIRSRLAGVRLINSAHSGSAATASIPPLLAAFAKVWQYVTAKEASPIGPPLIQRINRFETTLGWRAAVRRDTREPAEPPTTS